MTSVFTANHRRAMPLLPPFADAAASSAQPAAVLFAVNLLPSSSSLYAHVAAGVHTLAVPSSPAQPPYSCSLLSAELKEEEMNLK